MTEIILKDQNVLIKCTEENATAHFLVLEINDYMVGVDGVETALTEGDDEWLMRGYVTGEGCSNWEFKPNYMHHFCEEELDRVSVILRACFEYACKK